MLAKPMLRSAVCDLVVALAPAAAALAEPAPTVDLSAEGHARAPNDLATAEAYVEYSGAEAADVAAQVNRSIAAALETAQAHPAVRVKTGGTSTWPVYANNARTISAWRMRSTLRLESDDIAALSTLAGVFQRTLAIANLQLQPAPETLAKASDAAAVEAIAAFRQRAALIADALGKGYRIKHLSINTQGQPAPMYRARAMAAEMVAASPAPIEAGDASVTVHANGTIELID